MNSQPNEIITHILSYLDNYTLMFARTTCHKWKHLIETRIFYKKNIPALHVCLLTSDYYHFGKHYLNHVYDTKKQKIPDIEVNDGVYYDNLVRIITCEIARFNPPFPEQGKFFHNVIPKTNSILSLEHLLTYASYRNHLEIIKYLVNLGADIHIHDSVALRWSAKKGHLEVIKYLVSIGADHHAWNDNALRLSAEKGHLDVTKYLVSIGADNHANNDCALRSSAEKGHLEVVKYLISIDADLHSDNDYALRLSAENGHLEVAKYLISIGADCHAYNDAALRWSAPNGHLEVIKYLISVGADYHVWNDWILKNGTPKVIEYLKSISEKN